MLEEFAEEQGVSLNEAAVVADIHRPGWFPAAMVDVGASVGATLAPFLVNGWNILAFEPDPRNRRRLLERFGAHSTLQVDGRALGDRAEATADFYVSDVSRGISSLLPFHESHRLLGQVAVVPLSTALREWSVTRIDFLKVDAEGFDLQVLHGLTGSDVRPAVVECEFEDAKSRRLGYTYHDLGSFLLEMGYSVWLSEWYPVVQYGPRHPWRRLSRYPCDLMDAAAWGNFLAFTDPPHEDALHQAVLERLEPPPPSRRSTSTVITPRDLDLTGTPPNGGARGEGAER